MKLPLEELGELQPRWTRTIGQHAAQAGTAVIREATRTLVERFTLQPSSSSGSSSSSSSSDKCGPGDDSGLCQKPTGESTQTLPIVLGVVIPVTCATIVLVYLHRRNKKQQAIEDIDDRYKSLDFGLDLNMQPPPAAKKRGFGGRRGPKQEAPEMIITDLGTDPTRPGKKRGGLSLDMLGSPYMMPPQMRGSQESLRSISRAAPDEHDPYRPVTFARSSQDTARSPRPFRDNGSTYSSSTIHTGVHDKSSLIGNAKRMSQSYAQRSSSLTRTETNQSDGMYLEKGPSDNRSRSLSRTSLEKQPSQTSEERRNLSPIPSPGVESQINAFPLPPEPPAEETQRPPRTSSIAQPYPSRKSSASVGLQISVQRPMSDASYYEEDEEPGPLPPPKITTPEDRHFSLQDYDIDPSMIYTDRYSIDNSAASPPAVAPGNRISMMGLRPLPPDHPEENPEQRANRIRSFYKEYFDDSRPNPANAYYEDFEANYADYYYHDGWYDPETGEYYQPQGQAPFAQPMGRRAMTPPPGGAAHRGHGGAGRFSSMSAGGARGPFRGRAPPPPKKKLPPPVALTSLPTPHLLKSDQAIMNTVEFAPPASFRELQNGRRPDSPMGIQRPYSPAVKAYSPLVSTFEGLNPLPSPHHLRKSGTFTTLDFSPQVPRFLGDKSPGASDAGSIRSARSGISAMHQDAIKGGAYRISRIPKNMVTTKDDLSLQLRPKMDLISPA